MTETRRLASRVAFVAALVLAGCSTPAPSGSPPGSDGGPAGSSEPSSAASPVGSEGASPAAMIPQPSEVEIEVADPAARVDLVMPVFSDPTNITNPLFPVALASSNLLVGTVDDKAFRTEVTVLPTTRVVDWEGQRVETVVSQYAAFLDGRIHEIAYDLYAQADDGSVWYFGEDVFNFADGAIVDTHGTWHAGVDGPAAMIMPADPAVGDVYRPENIPGLVFEEVVVRSVDEQLDGPFGPIEGGLLAEEHHADGGTENKQFAPAYGEFYTAAGGEVEALALAVPTDVDSDAMPDALSQASELATAAIEAALDEDLATAEQIAGELEAAVSEIPEDDVPLLLRPLLEDAIAGLGSALDDGDPGAAAAAVIGASRLVGDLRLRYVDIPDVDRWRIGLWGAQLVLDAAAEDLDAIRADSFALTYTRERLTGGSQDDFVAELNPLLEELQSAIDDEDYAAITETGEAIRAAAASE